MSYNNTCAVGLAKLRGGVVSVLTTSLVRKKAYYVYMCIFHATIRPIPRLVPEFK